MWSFILEGIGMTGAYLAGRKMWWSWVILFVNAFLWTIYGFKTHQYGFCIASLFYGPIYLKNTIHWRKRDKRIHS
jgi:hypothetical protein